MGVFKALSASIKGVAADQWKEFFTCDAMPDSILMTRGHKMTGASSSNTSSNDNVITDGSVVAVADGQCAIITQSSIITAVCKEPGENIYHSEDSPSVFGGNLTGVVKEVGRRFTYGGDLPYSPERVYYINTKEIKGIPFSFESPVPFRMRHDEIGADMDLGVNIGGVFSIRITSPETFYKKIAGNVPGTYYTENLLGQIKTEFLSAVQQTFGLLTAQGLRVSSLPSLGERLSGEIRKQINSFLKPERGISVESIAFDTLTLTGPDGEKVKTIQYYSVFRDPSMGAAAITGAVSEAMPLAASNPSGAVAGFAGISFAANAAGNLQQTENIYWVCRCGSRNKGGNYCSECGEKRP
ncbi:MAG: SPFH domain-containing protein [Clostridia bacterium]|nr:SPFH domain-containing protein [Clostridia bacterium]